MVRRKAYNEHVDTYSDRIYTYLIKHLGDVNSAQDLTQDTFLQLWKHRKKVENDSVKAWLFRTAYNSMLNHIKKHKRTAYAPELHENSSIDNYSSYETMDLLNEAFEQLNPVEKSLVLLKDSEGYSYDEISQMHDISLVNIKSKLFRARKKMRIHLEKLQSLENMRSYE